MIFTLFSEEEPTVNKAHKVISAKMLDRRRADHEQTHQ